MGTTSRQSWTRGLFVSCFAVVAFSPAAGAGEEMIMMAGSIPDDRRELSGQPDLTSATPLATAAHQPWLTGSSIALSRDETKVLVVDTDNRTLTISETATGTVIHRVPVGRMPERVVVGLGGLAYVTNRGSRSVSVVDIGSGKEVRSLEAGVEPYGIALTPDATTLMVVASASAEILLFDTATLALRRRIESERPWPAAIAADPNGRRAYVTYLAGRTIDIIDVQKGRVVGTLALPEKGSGLPGRLMGRGETPRKPNLAVAVVVSPGGKRLFVAHTMVDTGDLLAAAGVVDGGYGLGSASPIVASVSTFDLEKGTFVRPAPDFENENPRIGWISRADQAAQRLAQPMALAHDPRRSRLLLVAQGSDMVMSLDTRSSDPFTEPLGAYTTGQAPKGVAFSADGSLAFVHNAHDHTVSVFSMDIAPPAESEPARFAMTSARSFEIGKSPLPKEAAKGRRLFTYALDSRVGGPLKFACASCHPDGRHDSMVWHVSVGPRQTPILADRVRGTGPFNWIGTEDGLHENVRQTIRRLGGTGTTPEEVDQLTTYVQSYLPGLDNPARQTVAQAATQAVVAEGKRLFHDAQVGCSGCHDSRTQFTDGALHEVGTTSPREFSLWEKLGKAVDMAKRGGGPVAPAAPGTKEPVAEAPVSYNTPGLRHLWASAPYYHDGSQATLKALLTTGNAGDKMGRTSHLTDRQVDALVAYLLTL